MCVSWRRPIETWLRWSKPDNSAPTCIIASASFPLRLPPLRERPEDIPVLARHFMAQCAERMRKTVDTIEPETMAAMLSHDWPGNIRELQNFIERGVMLSRESVFQAPPSLLRGARRETPGGIKTLSDSTRDHILQALDHSNWVIGGKQGAAAYLGIPRTTLIFKMRRLGIESPPIDSALSGTRREQAFASTA
jgi:DNA-binding NtrC family response regulator